MGSTIMFGRGRRLFRPVQNTEGIQWIRHRRMGAGKADVSVHEDLATHVSFEMPWGLMAERSDSTLALG